MKTLFCLLVMAATLVAARAQDTIALQVPGGNTGGYAMGTAGWSFQPLTNVSVTALGCFDNAISSESGPIAVGLWAADGTLLASNTITTNSTLINFAGYELIDPVLLSTNETYYLGAFGTAGAMIINFFSPEFLDMQFGFVDMAPEIQLGTAISSTNESFSFPGEAIDSSGSAVLAPNFEFQDGVIPPVLDVANAGTNVLLSWSATYAGYALQENGDLNTTNWMTATNSVVTAGGQNQVLISSPAGNNFYRLKSP